jgi:AraC-like DNA-binding protein
MSLVVGAGFGQAGGVPDIERARTGLVVVESFAHAPGEPLVATEWWPRGCIAFTTFGSWEIRCGRGGGRVDARTVLVAEADTEYDCVHEHGTDDRALCVTFRTAVDVGPAVLVPLGPRFQALRRALAAELRATVPDGDEIDQLSLALLQLTREGGDRRRRPRARTGRLIATLRDMANARYPDPTLDLVAEAAALGMGRTRLVHAFQEVVGITPHRYLVELRIAHAARLLTETAMPVIEVCFASGFGSVARFNAMFQGAFGITPTAYRARYRRA